MQDTIPKLEQSIDAGFTEVIETKINQKTKPIGSLGTLESLAKQISLIQQSLSPSINDPHLLVFAADHGIANEGVSAYPQAVTAQMVQNFLAGGAAINVLTKQHGLAFKLVDAGVNDIFEPHASLIDAKIGMGTANFLHTPAMSAAQCKQALQAGEKIMQDLIDQGCNTIGFGEMGIANTSAASALMAAITALPIAECVGLGTGISDAGLDLKKAVIEQAIKHHGLNKSSDPIQILASVGGFEIAMMVGAMHCAAMNRCTIIIDGFIVSSALLVAHAMSPNILDYCVFSHCSDESPHAALLAFLQAKPLLNLGLRLGEGSGAALAYPIIESAVLLLNEMATFESASVSEAT